MDLYMVLLCSKVSYRDRKWFFQEKSPLKNTPQQKNTFSVLTKMKSRLFFYCWYKTIYCNNMRKLMHTQHVNVLIFCHSFPLSVLSCNQTFLLIIKKYSDIKFTPTILIKRNRMSFCLFAPKDLANGWTDMVLIYGVDSHR